MTGRLYDAITQLLEYANWHVPETLYLVYLLLIVFFLFSRRMNARAVVPAPALRWLPHLSRELLEKEAPLQSSPDLADFIQKMRRGTARLLIKIDSLLYDKLKLLPDAHTGRRLNLFLMFFIAWATVNGRRLLNFGEAQGLAGSAFAVRNGGTEAAPMWVGLSLHLLYAALLAVPVLLLLRKNRELYLDIGALFILLITAVEKLALCWVAGCCFGVPWAWGVHNDLLETTVFPVQLFESASLFLGAVLCVLYMLYAKSYKPGRGCLACMLALFVPRFFWDYMRYHGEAYRPAEAAKFFGFTSVQIFCAAGVVLALVWPLLLPLEKKLMDRLTLFVANGLRKLAVKIRLFQKWQLWRERITAPEETDAI